eukprot:6194934-Pleurochrysis_carterae.AAC.1
MHNRAAARLLRRELPLVDERPRVERRDVEIFKRGRLVDLLGRGDAQPVELSEAREQRLACVRVMYYAQSPWKSSPN